MRYFFQGLLYIAPIGVTIYILYLVFMFIDGLLKSSLEKVIGFSIPGLGVLIIFILLTILGFLGQSILAQPFKLIFRKVLKKVPIVQLVYSALNDLFSAFVGKEKKFQQVVLVKVNTISELEKLGFITQTDLSELGITDKVAVYFPHSYNFSGELFIVPSQHVKPLDIPPSDAMKFIVSGGITRVR